MTPYEIDVLIWYHSRCEDHPDVGRNPPVWRPTINSFISDGLIQTPQDQSGIRRDMVYAPTDRLHAYVDALCSVPLPRPGWNLELPPQPDAVAEVRNKVIEECAKVCEEWADILMEAKFEPVLQAATVGMAAERIRKLATGTESDLAEKE